jgi:hypothetical protein
MKRRKALLLPAIFAVVVVPIALFVISGAGTHMSGLLLYLPAAPWWWLLYRGGTFVTETAEGDAFAGETSVLLVGCAINAFLLYLLGAAMDRHAKKRRA